MGKKAVKGESKATKPGGTKFVPDPEGFRENVRRANEILATFHVGADPIEEKGKKIAEQVVNYLEGCSYASEPRPRDPGQSAPVKAEAKSERDLVQIVDDDIARAKTCRAIRAAWDQVEDAALDLLGRMFDVDEQTAALAVSKSIKKWGEYIATREKFRQRVTPEAIRASLLEKVPELEGLDPESDRYKALVNAHHEANMKELRENLDKLKKLTGMK